MLTPTLNLKGPRSQEQSYNKRYTLKSKIKKKFNVCGSLTENSCCVLFTAYIFKASIKITEPLLVTDSPVQFRTDINFMYVLYRQHFGHEDFQPLSLNWLLMMV